jgi:NAD(P)-dependent dehydrogenase (short-subunit alcohol dehydrogenase family)
MTLTKDSVVVVTGAASGIGRALALRLAREGIARLVISDVNAEGLDETSQLIGGADLVSPPVVSTHVVNVADFDQMRKFVGDVVTQHGRVTHLINNAGVSLAGTVEEVSIADIEWLMNINFWGTVYGVKLFLPILHEQPAGHIINVSSIFGMIAPPGTAAYSASKFAVRGFTEALRHELAETNIAVSCVHPGGVITNIARNSRVGEGTDASVKEKSTALHAKASRTTAETAAAAIVRGIKRRSKRILVGSDARIIDALQRTAPVSYFSVMDWLYGGEISSLLKKS